MSGLFLAGCSPVPPAPNENLTILYDRFHGKYEPIQSTSSEAVDVNLDGKASADMLVEIPQLSRKYSNALVLRIDKSQRLTIGSRLWYYQLWPDQHVSIVTNNRNYEWKGEMISYDSTLTINYLSNPIGYSFAFSTDLKQINLNPSPAEDSFRRMRPESVTINPDNTIQVVGRRRFYTSAGVKDVLITTIYRRYTTVT